MASVGTLYPHVIDMTRQMHRGKVLPDVQLLHQEDGLTGILPAKQCNDGTTHLWRTETALPTVYQTAHGEGALPSKSQGAEERATCTMLQSWSVIPRTTSMIGGAQAALRAKEDGQHREAMRQKYNRTLVYDNRNINLNGIYGIQPLFNRLAAPKLKQFFDAGGTVDGQLTSIYFFNAGPDFYVITPEGIPGGYRRINHGQQVETRSNGNQLSVFKTEHEWHFGMVNEAWPSIFRTCNINVPDLLTLTNNQAPTSFLNVIHSFMFAKSRFRRRMGTPYAMVSDSVWLAIMRIASVSSQNVVTIEKAAGQFGDYEKLFVHGVRVIRNDQILETESRVTNAT
jgi:hypothetical protein